MKRCKIGYYQNLRGQGSCTICPAGYYCNMTVDGVVYGSEKPAECPDNRYCPEGTGDPKRCPDGTYAATGKRLETLNHCIPCKPGRYCKDGVINDQQLCDAGYFCKSGAASPNDSNMKCPAGFYCDRGTKIPKKCLNGKFSKEGAVS